MVSFRPEATCLDSDSETVAPVLGPAVGNPSLDLIGPGDPAGPGHPLLNQPRLPD